MSTLTLSGWGQPAEALQQVAPGAAAFDYSNYATTQQALEALITHREVEHVVGWSLGGQLALHAIAAGALRPRHLTLISVPYQFVKGGNVAEGMDRFTFDTFRNNYATDPARTATRFHGLVAKGDRDARRIMQNLSHHEQIHHAPHWLPWLDALDHEPVSKLDLTNIPPTTIIHGTADGIVPIAQVHQLAAALPLSRVDIWEGVGHAPHVHDAARLLRQRSAA